MDEKPAVHGRKGINRRGFIGALGAGAIAGTFLQRGGQANAEPAQTYYYQDSFGNVVPAGQGAVQLGVFPPAVPAGLLPLGAANPDADSGVAGTTYYTGHPNYNILLIMVDQMRNPAFWLPAGNNNWLTAYGDIMPNIALLASKSFGFPNYWVAATVCGPSRACLLTGLYAQQTCMFKSGSAGRNGTGGSTPPLLPYNNSWNNNTTVPIGFPTIGNVLSQVLPIGSSANNASYDCTWIGKWHLSCATGKPDYAPGADGPSDYGFNPDYSIPSTGQSPRFPYPAASNGYPSPDGVQNEGTGGDFLDSYPQITERNVPNWPLTMGNNASFPDIVQLNDAAIAYAFTNWYLPAANAHFNPVNNNQQPPWFCAVSFINPHDMSGFPFEFGLTSVGNNNFGDAPDASNTFYQSPPTNTAKTAYYGNSCGSGCLSDGDVAVINGFLTNTAGPYIALPPGTGNTGPWNYEDPSALPYASHGKPDLQAFFEAQRDADTGTIKSPGSYNSSNNGWPNPTPWQTFLNYYLWMQSCVDYQVGQVLGTNPSSNTYQPGLAQYPTFSNNTVVVFTADHGDYGGSHGLHAKGGALYEEVMNVPLYISFPSMRNNSSLDGPILLPYVCSSVDLLPFLYTLALGNASWRTNNSDMVYTFAAVRT